MPLIPGRNLVLLAIAPVVLAVLTLFDPSMLWPMLMVDAGILLLAAVDGVMARKPLVTVKRELPDVFSIGRQNPVGIELRSVAGRRLKVAVNIDLFDYADADALPLSLKVPRKGRQSTRFTVQPNRRGAYNLGATHLRYRSPLGLWIRQQTVSTSAAVRVYPDVHAVRDYELLARQDKHHALSRTSRRLGGESEFEQLREYSRDDEYRSIDWRATARAGKLIARQYQLESDQNVMFVLDAGRLMTAESNGLALFDHSLNAMLMLAHVAVRGGDKVGMLAFGSEITGFVPPSGGKVAVSKLIQTSYAIHPKLERTDYEQAMGYLGTRVRKRTLMVLFTQLVDDQAALELTRLTRSVMRKHLPLIVLLRDSEMHALVHEDTGKPADLYVRGAAAEMIGWREQVIRTLENAGALILDVEPTDLTAKVINRYLEIKARHLL